jgi:hypothetical protein
LWPLLLGAGNAITVGWELCSLWNASNRTNARTFTRLLSLLLLPIYGTLTMSRRTKKGRASSRASAARKRKLTELELDAAAEKENISLQHSHDVENQQIEEFKKAKLQALLSDFDNEGQRKQANSITTYFFFNKI